MSTNGKSAIALEESVICSRWEFSSDMFARILKLWIVMEVVGCSTLHRSVYSRKAAYMPEALNSECVCVSATTSSHAGN